MKQQAGQATIVTLALTATLVAAVLLVFNVGQLINGKQRLVNAADAAAYSAAVWEARSLNYQAYLNRAVIANEAAIAQAVSLRSWSAYLNRTLTNANSVLQFLPYIGAATRALSRIWWRIDAEVQPTLLLAEAATSELDHGFAAAAELLHASTAANVLPVIEAVASRAHGAPQVTPGGAALVARNVREFGQLTRRFAGTARGRQADLVVRTLDRFTRDRPWNPRPVIDAGLTRWSKRGGTDLLGYDEWRAMDTFAVHRRRFGFIGGWREALSIGWGGARNGQQSFQRGEHGGSWRTNPRTSRRAAASTVAGVGYRGIPALRDVSPQRATADVTELRIAIEVARPAESLALADRALRGAQARSLTGRSAAFRLDRGADTVRAISEARVVFDAPEGRRDGRVERATLFNPYWRARLAPVSRESRAIAAAANGVVDPSQGLVP